MSAPERKSVTAIPLETLPMATLDVTERFAESFVQQLARYDQMSGEVVTRA